MGAKMAKCKRIALSLPPESDAVITKLSKLVNTPKTAIITELVVQALPHIELAIKAIEESKKNQVEQAIQTVAGFLQEASMQVNQAHIEFGQLKGSLNDK